MTICLAALCCVLSVFLSWRYIQKTYAAIDTIFDSILAQKAGLSFETELDSRLSKLTHKAIKIVQMNSADVVQLGQEKQTIQSLLSDMSHQNAAFQHLYVYRFTAGGQSFQRRTAGVFYPYKSRHGKAGLADGQPDQNVKVGSRRH